MVLDEGYFSSFLKRVQGLEKDNRTKGCFPPKISVTRVHTP